MICGPGSPCLYDTAYGNSLDGDTIVFAPGDYTFSATLRVEKRLTLEGAAGGPVPHLLITAGGSSDGIDYIPTTSSTPAAIRRLRIEVPNAGTTGIFVNNPFSAPARMTIEDVVLLASTSV